MAVARDTGGRDLIGSRSRGAFAFAPGVGTSSGPNVRDDRDGVTERRLVAARLVARSTGGARVSSPPRPLGSARDGEALVSNLRLPFVSSRPNTSASVTSPPGARFDVSYVARSLGTTDSNARVASRSTRHTHAIFPPPSAVYSLAPSEENATLDTRPACAAKVCAASERASAGGNTKSRRLSSGRARTAPSSPPTTRSADEDARGSVAKHVAAPSRQPEVGTSGATLALDSRASSSGRGYLATDLAASAEATRRDLESASNATATATPKIRNLATSARVSASKSRATSAPGPTTAIRLPSGDAAETVPRFSLDAPDAAKNFTGGKPSAAASCTHRVPSAFPTSILRPHGVNVTDVTAPVPRRCSATRCAPSTSKTRTYPPAYPTAK